MSMNNIKECYLPYSGFWDFLIHILMIFFLVNLKKILQGKDECGSHPLFHVVPYPQ